MPLVNPVTSAVTVEELAGSIVSGFVAPSAPARLSQVSAGTAVASAVTQKLGVIVNPPY